MTASTHPAGIEAELLPARQGDSILLEWPDGDTTRRMLLDGGPSHAYDAVSARLRQMPDRRVDVLVVTHIDSDHIGGVIRLLADSDLGLEIDDVWFNGGQHLTTEMSPAQGDRLGTAIVQRGLPWNDHFHGAAIRVDDARLPTVDLPGGVRVTVLAPDARALLRLSDVWASAVEEANQADQAEDVDDLDGDLDVPPIPPLVELLRVDREPDRKPPNGSSIVLLVERGESAVLLAGDSTPEVLEPAVRRLLAERGVDRLPLTQFKLPHHASAANVTKTLIELLPAARYLISTDGSYFSHPDDAALAVVLTRGPRGLALDFNYDSPRNRRWGATTLCEDYGHTVSFGAGQAKSAIAGDEHA